MIPELEAGVALPIPGAGPTGLVGQIITVPILTTTTSVQVMGRDCYLMGFSFRETTGTGGAVAEIIDGFNSSGPFVAAVNLVGGFDVQASQTPAATSSSAGNAALAPAIGGGAGLTTFVTSIRITGLGATGSSEVTATLTGVLGGTISYPITVPAGATTPITPIFDSFGTRGLQATGPATAITLNVPAFGAGNTLEEASIVGYTTAAAGAGLTQGIPGDGIYIRSGVFLNVISGSLKGAVWIRI